MELDNLKYIWQNIETPPGARDREPSHREGTFVKEPSPTASPWEKNLETDRLLQDSRDQQIRHLLHKKSRGPAAAMRRNLIGELVAMIGLYTPPAVYYIFHYGGRLSAISWFLLLMGLLFGTYLYRMQKILREMHAPASQVGANLRRQVEALEKYIRAYLVAGTLLVPVAAGLLGALLYGVLPPPPASSLLYPDAGNPLWRVVLLWVAGLSVATGAMYFINAWNIRRQYGRYIARLREMLEEINEG